MYYIAKEDRDVNKIGLWKHRPSVIRGRERLSILVHEVYPRFRLVDTMPKNATTKCCLMETHINVGAGILC